MPSHTSHLALSLREAKGIAVSTYDVDSGERNLAEGGYIAGRPRWEPPVSMYVACREGPWESVSLLLCRHHRLAASILIGVGSTLALDVAIATAVNAIRKPPGVNAILYWHSEVLCSVFVFWYCIGRLGRTVGVFLLLRRRTLPGAADGCLCVVVCIRSC